MLAKKYGSLKKMEKGKTKTTSANNRKSAQNRMSKPIKMVTIIIERGMEMAMVTKMEIIATNCSLQILKRGMMGNA